MKSEIYQSINVLLQNDDTVTPGHRQEVLRVCRSPKTHKNGHFCSARVAAEILDCHVKTVYRYAKKDLLHPIHHSARKVRFDRDEVERFAAHGLDGESSLASGNDS